jgi:predicted porin
MRAAAAAAEAAAAAAAAAAAPTVLDKVSTIVALLDECSTDEIAQVRAHLDALTVNRSQQQLDKAA